MTTSFNSSYAKILLLLGALMLALLPLLQASPAQAANGIDLYTSNKNVTVTPGKDVTFGIELINSTNEIKDVPLRVTGLPEGWTYTMTKAAWEISEMAVKGESEQSFNLEVVVPLQVEKGEYPFNLIAEGYDTMPLTITVSETGIFETELTTEQSNLQGDAGASFTYSLDLRNRTAENQLYSLTAEAPQGWEVLFKVSGKQVTSTEVEAGQSQSVSVEVTPAEQVEEGTFTIPVKATAGETSASLDLEAVITGKYDMMLTTPKGLLSTEITAGKTTKVELEVKNTGTTALEDVRMSYQAPVEWEVTFEPETIEKIEPGASGTVTAIIKSSDKAIPGDYATSITARTPEVSSIADFRVTVKTSVLWGWLGILIIAAVLGGLYYLFRKYGRR